MGWGGGPNDSKREIGAKEAIAGKKSLIRGQLTDRNSAGTAKNPMLFIWSNYENDDLRQTKEIGNGFGNRC